ncbi:probable metabolite transport protein CsbC isoform X4 [Leptinotarsa decemlineata]|uniref:probable metabolite transport protein CsbC isoform X4 n=1 Tax=Leptinotarsa decemlineata TaxID=7539 RepID=UPI003D3081D1
MIKMSITAMLVVLAGNLWLLLHFLAIYDSLKIISKQEDYVVAEKLSVQIYVIGALKGCLFFCALAHYFGRKISIGTTGFPLAVGYLLLSVAENIGVICCGRFLMGFSWGGTLAVLPIYFGEIATKSSRGIILTTIVVSLQIGSILDAFGATGAFFCLLLIDWIGRKKCLLLSTSGVTLSLLMFELFRSHENSYLQLLFFTSSIIFQSMGIIPVRKVFLGELFSLKFKMAGAALITIHYFSMGLLLSYFNLTTYELFDTNGSFYFGMIVCAMAAIFVHFCFPETKGKSLEHIQVILNRT